MINFYDSLRYELNDSVGITLATHGWIGGDMSRGKFMLEEGSEMQWREEKEVTYMVKLLISDNIISCQSIQDFF